MYDFAASVADPDPPPPPTLPMLRNMCERGQRARPTARLNVTKYDILLYKRQSIKHNVMLLLIRICGLLSDVIVGRLRECQSFGVSNW